LLFSFLCQIINGERVNSREIGSVVRPRRLDAPYGFFRMLIALLIM